MIDSFVEALKDKGYSPYLADMFGKMLQDLQGRADELSKLSGFKFSVQIEA